MLRFALIFGVAIVVFDIIVSAIARAVGVSYGSFLLVALVLYALFGIFAGQRLRWPRALVTILIVVAIDATLGTFAAAAVGSWVRGSTTRDVIVAISLTSLLSLCVGAVGIALGARARRAAQ